MTAPGAHRAGAGAAGPGSERWAAPRASGAARGKARLGLDGRPGRTGLALRRAGAPAAPRPRGTGLPGRTRCSEEPLRSPGPCWPRLASGRAGPGARECQDRVGCRRGAWALHDPLLSAAGPLGSVGARTAGPRRPGEGLRSWGLAAPSSPSRNGGKRRCPLGAWWPARGLSGRAPLPGRLGSAPRAGPRGPGNRRNLVRGSRRPAQPTSSVAARPVPGIDGWTRERAATSAFGEGRKCGPGLRLHRAP